MKRVLGTLLIGIVCTSCSINKLAMNAVSDALAGDGGSEVFTGDEDPELVAGAIPFAIKMYETLLAQNPRHQGLILTTGSLFVMYANAFIQGPAQMSDDFEEQQREMVRAKKLYLRGRGILLDGLDQKYAGFANAFRTLSVDSYLPRFKKDDVPNLYWMTAGTMAAYSLNPFDLELGVSLPVLRKLIDRAYQLDPDFNNGAIDDFYVLLLASLPPEMGGDKSLAEEHFRRAVEKSKGLSAGPYISYAESICIPAQDYEHFKENIEKALAVDPSKDPANRLVNIINQRKAQYLLDNASHYFIDIGDDSFDWGDDEDFEGEWW